MGTAVYLNPHARPASTPAVSSHEPRRPGDRSALRTATMPHIPIANMPTSTKAMPAR